MAGDPASKRPRDAGRSTADIPRAAEAEFATYGFAGARVDRIAAESGTNKALLFHRFSDKGGLYRAVLERNYSRPPRGLRPVPELATQSPR